jgi:hypothetical protein
MTGAVLAEIRAVTHSVTAAPCVNLYPAACDDPLAAAYGTADCAKRASA